MELNRFQKPKWTLKPFGNIPFAHRSQDNLIDQSALILTKYIFKLKLSSLLNITLVNQALH